jgi:(p)ppGpp synthase/HD superfamily hydrolase
MFTLEQAIALAATYHAGQADKSKKPYIYHPLRVLLSAQSKGYTQYTQMVAVLHDTLEDTPLTAKQLRERDCPEIVIEALVALTRLEGEVYLTEYIPRVSENLIARLVKLLDLEDNSSEARINALPESERGVLKRYQKAKKLLEV